MWVRPTASKLRGLWISQTTAHNNLKDNGKAQRRHSAPHDAREPAAAALALHVDELRDLEDLLEVHLGAHLELRGELFRAAQLADGLLRRLAVLLVLASERLVRALGAALAEADDQGDVAVLLLSALAENGQIALDDGAAQDVAVLGEVLRHTELLADDAGIRVHLGASCGSRGNSIEFVRGRKAGLGPLDASLEGPVQSQDQGGRAAKRVGGGELRPGAKEIKPSWGLPGLFRGTGRPGSLTAARRYA